MKSLLLSRRPFEKQRIATLNQECVAQLSRKPFGYFGRRSGMKFQTTNGV